MIDIQDIRTARDRIAGSVRLTPVIHSAVLSEICESQVYFKLETLQETGSFKTRGAMNRISASTKRNAKKA